MFNFSGILNEMLLTEGAEVSQVNDAIDQRFRVLINYHSKGENIATGARIIEVHAYGLTKAGNPVIRAFQPFGDTTTKVPNWKFFRLDRISYWKPLEQHFDSPASDRFGGLGEFNPTDDKTMSVVYKIVQFDQPSGGEDIPPASSAPVSNKPEVYQTPGEIEKKKALSGLEKQLANKPININDFIKQNGGFKPSVPTQMEPVKQDTPYPDTTNTVQTSQGEQPAELMPTKEPPVQQNSGPVPMDNDKVEQPLTNTNNNPNLFRTDSEKAEKEKLSGLSKQLNNPNMIRIDPSKLGSKQKYFK